MNDGFAARGDGGIYFGDPFDDTYDGMGFSKGMGYISQEAIITAGGLRGAAWFGGTKYGRFLDQNRYIRVGPGNIPKGKPYTLGPGQKVPTMSMGNGKPSPFNHLDLRMRNPPRQGLEPGIGRLTDSQEGLASARE